jgi:hypothetical protein
MTWQVKGTYLEACNCEAACPCVFLSPPTEGNCTVLVGWHVDAGKSDDVRLDGFNVALLAHAPGNMKDGNWELALYLDERADAAQQKALGGIFSGQAGGHLSNLGPLIGKVHGVRPAKITFQHSGPSLQLEVDGVGAAKIKEVAGQGGGPIEISGHPLAISPGVPARLARSESLTVADYGMSCRVTGKNGFFSPFSYSG